MSEKLHDSKLWASSMFGYVTREPLVNLTCTNEQGETTFDIQISVEEARDHALRILEAAEAAEMDAIVWKFFSDKLNQDERKCGAILLDFRKLRDESREKRLNPTGETDAETRTQL